MNTYCYKPLCIKHIDNKQQMQTYVSLHIYIDYHLLHNPKAGENLRVDGHRECY